jgi:hypothetical protein
MLQDDFAGFVKIRRGLHNRINSPCDSVFAGFHFRPDFMELSKHLIQNHIPQKTLLFSHAVLHLIYRADSALSDAALSYQEPSVESMIAAAERTVC